MITKIFTTWSRAFLIGVVIVLWDRSSMSDAQEGAREASLERLFVGVLEESVLEIVSTRKCFT